MNLLLLSNYAPHTTSVLLKRGFEQAGHRVFAHGPDPAPSDWQRCTAQANVNALIADSSEPIELVLFVEASTGTAFFPRGFLDCPVPTAFWAIDNHLNYGWHRAIAGAFDLTFLAQKDFVERAKGEMMADVAWLPLAADPEWHFAPAESHPRRFRDAVFVGHLNAERRALFSHVRKRVPTFEEHSSVYGREVGQLYAEAKIGLNTCVNKDLNMRFFEVLASGALLMTEDIKAGMRDLFSEGEHFVTYRRLDAGDVMLRWLRDEERRERIGRQGRALCCSQHTYRHRAETIVRLVEEKAASFPQLRLRKKRSARLHWSVAAALRGRPFSLADEAKCWLREGFSHSQKWAAFPELLRYLKRAITARLNGTG